MRLGGFAAFMFLFCVAAAARADNPALARQHFERGSTLYDLGQFHQAAKEYEEAYKNKSDPVLLFNIGQAYRFAGENADALLAYRAYLRRLPDAANRQEVEARIARLQQLVDAQKASAPPPAPKPAPTTVARPAAPAAAVSTSAARPAEKPPLYKRWWLWTAVAGAAVVAVGVGLAIAYSVPKDAPAPPGAVGVMF